MKQAAALLMLTVLLSACAGTADRSAESQIERGKRLVDTVGACGNCHTPRDAKGAPLPGRELTGGREIREPAFVAYGTNLTPDAETGLGRWTLAQFKRAMREGVRPDGSLIGPPMPIPSYAGLADDDLAAMFAYLRSLPPVRNRTQRSDYSRIELPASYGPVTGKAAPPPRRDLVRYGEYLAGPVGHCVECHTPYAGGHHDYANRLGAGGRVWKGPFGVSIARNITPHESGLRDWSDGEIERAIREGIDRRGNRLKPPMAFHLYKDIDAHDMRALIAYMRALKPVPFAGH